MNEQLSGGTTILASSSNAILVRREDAALDHEGTVEVLNIHGNLVASQALNGAETTVDASGNASGIYIVRVTYNESIITRKVYLD